MNHLCCIAAHDTSAGAGVIRDCLVAHDFGVWPHPIVTALTCQSFNHVEKIFPIPAPKISRQIESVSLHFPIKALKVGMLYHQKVVEVVAEKLQLQNIPIVVDPVFISSGGETLATNSSFQTLISRIFPLATVITPNRTELEVIYSQKITTIEDAINASKTLACQWNNFILLKGGHFNESTITDFLISNTETIPFSHPRQEFYYSHGTGCVLSTAMASCLALNMNINEAFQKSIRYTIELYQNLNTSMFPTM